MTGEQQGQAQSKDCSRMVLELQAGAGCWADKHGEVSVQNILCAGLLIGAELGVCGAL